MTKDLSEMSMSELLQHAEKMLIQTKKHVGEAWTQIERAKLALKRAK